jgi:hypothetical protein
MEAFFHILCIIFGIGEVVIGGNECDVVDSVSLLAFVVSRMW